MTNEELIAIETFCIHQEVETTFVLDLHERGLIHITVVNDKRFLVTDELPRIEQLARMHYDLDINPEGLEAISHLLERMQALQERMHEMELRVKMFDADMNQLE